MTWKQLQLQLSIEFLSQRLTQDGCFISIFFRTFFIGQPAGSLFLSWFVGVDAAVVPLRPAPLLSLLTNCILEKEPLSFCARRVDDCVRLCLSLALCPQATLQPSRASCFTWTPPAACSTGPFWRLRCWQLSSGRTSTKLRGCLFISGDEDKISIKKNKIK